eukprot:7006322-Prymnesium_polylepis.1
MRPQELRLQEAELASVQAALAEARNARVVLESAQSAELAQAEARGGSEARVLVQVRRRRPL